MASPRLVNNLPRARRLVRDAAARGVARAAGFVRDLARQLAPYDDRPPPARPPGPHLRDTIAVEPAQPRLRMQVTAGRGLPDPRAVANEYGLPDRFYPPQPYMTPAARQVKVGPEVTREVRGALRGLRSR